MAELNVEPKSKSPWWIWLIVAIIVLGILFFFIGGNNENRNDAVPPNTDSDTTGITGMGKTDLNRNYIAGTDYLFLDKEVMRKYIAVPCNG